MTLSIKVDEVEYVDSVVIEQAQFTQGNGPNPGDFYCRVKDPDKTLTFRAGQSIAVDFGGIPVFDGYVMQASMTHAFPVVDTVTDDPEDALRFWILKGVDINILFRKRWVFNQDDPGSPLVIEYPPDTPDLVYIRDIMDHLTIEDDNLVTDFHHVASPEPDRKGLGLSLGDSWETAFATAARIPGAVWGIRPGRRSRFNADAFDDDAFALGDSAPLQHRVVYWEDDDTITAPFAISDTPNEPASFGYSNFEWLEDGSQMVNDAQIWGVGMGKSSLTYAHVVDEDSVEEHGRWENEGGWRYDLWRQASVDRVAESLVYGSPAHLHGPKDPAIRVKCRVRQPGLMAGDKIRIISDVYGEDIVLPIRRLKTTFVDRDSLLFDLEATWELDAELTIVDPWPNDGDDNPPPDDDAAIDDPCQDFLFFLGGGGDWHLVRSDPRLGTVVGFPTLAAQEAAFLNKRRYWQLYPGNKFVSAHGDGIDDSGLFAHYWREIPRTPYWGLSFEFQVPSYTTAPHFQTCPFPYVEGFPECSGSDNPGAVCWGCGDYSKTGRFSLDVSILERGGSEFSLVSRKIRLMACLNGNNFVLGQTGSQATSSWWKFDLLPWTTPGTGTGGVGYVYPATDARPATPTFAGNTNFTGGDISGNAGSGLPVRQLYVPFSPTNNTTRLVFSFDIHGDIDEEDTQILITNEPGDPSNDMILMDRFLDETWMHDRLLHPFSHSLYGWYGNTEATPIWDGYSLNARARNGQILYSINGLEPTCGDNIPQVESGERYCEQLERLSDTDFGTDYAFVTGSSMVNINGLKQRTGVDYEEDPVGRRIIFPAGAVPPDDNVYACYRTVV